MAISAPESVVTDSLLDLLPLAILMADAEGYISFANARYLALFGLSPDTACAGVPADEWLRRLAPCFADPEAVVQATQQAADRQEPQERLQLALANGRVVERDAVLLPGGGWLVTYRDVTDQVLAERALKSIARIPEQNPNPILRLAADGRTLYRNPAGLALRNRVGPAVIDNVRSQVAQMARAALAANEPRQTELALGDSFFQIDIAPVPEEGYVNMYFIDITARRAIKDELRRQKAFYEAILNDLPADVVMLDPALRYRYANPHAVPDPALRQWLIGHDDLEFFAHRGRPKAMGERRQQLLRQAFAERRRIQWEETYDQAGGGQRHVTRFLQPVFNAAGQPDMIIGYGLDITPIRAAQQILEQSEKRYHDLMHYSQALICSHTLDGVILAANPALARLLDLPPDELVGQSLTLLAPPADRAAIADYLARFAVSPKAQSRGLVRLQPRPGQPPLCLLYQNVRVEEAGQAPYVIGYAQDVTERVLAEEATKQVARAREYFMATMSHEIRTPLSAVLGLTTLLAKTPLDAEQRQYLDLIGLSGRTLLGLINNVLDMSKISSGKLELAAVPFELCDTISQTIQPLVVQAAERGLGFSIVPLGLSDVWVLGDPGRLMQVITNLLANAVKFTHQGGVTLEGRVRHSSTTGLTVTFLVSDTGIGIAPERQGSIFEDFTQASADTSSRYGGTGLGLAISRRLLTQMGSRLLVTSEVGVGTTFGFTITLPRTAAPGPSSPVAAMPPKMTLQGRRVLLVEDHAVNRLLARLILMGQGALVEEAADGHQALALATHEGFDVILMDIQLPGLNGVEVTAAIRALPDPVRAQVPILALTANAFREDLTQYLTAGMDAYLTKPFEEEALLRTVASLLKETPVEAAAALVPAGRLPAQPVGADGQPRFPATAWRLTHGNEAALRQLVEEFVATTPPLVQELVSPAITSPRVAAIAHQLVATAQLFDATELFMMLQAMEACSPTHPAMPYKRAYTAQLLNDLLARAEEWRV